MAAASIRPKGRKRAEAILDAATSVLANQGHAALSLREVAIRAGVRLGHLQYYYRSKADLLRALIARELERAAALIEAGAWRTPGSAGPGKVGTGQAASSGDPVALLIETVLDQQRDRDTVLLFGELRALAARDPVIAALVRAYYSRYWRAVAGALVAGRPDLGRARAERRAALLVATLEGLLQFRSPDDPRQLPLLGVERELVDLAAALSRP